MLNMLSYLLSGGTLALYALLILVLRLPIVCISLSMHESAHGYAALKLGDPTARNLGRISMNPMKHFSLVGTLSMIFLGIGWAKPVPINTRYFKNAKKGMAWSSAAGPLSNLLLALAGVLLLRIFDIIFFEGAFYYYYAQNMVDKLFGSDLDIMNKLKYVLMLFLEMLSVMNISLALFNLIPIPPFDGSRIAFALLPDRIYFGIMKYESIIMIVFIFLFYRFGDGFSDIVYWVYGGFYEFLILITGFLT